MDITEVRIKLIQLTDDRLQAFCSITIDDCFVIRDLKIIDGPNGPFIAMPSRKITCHCTFCSGKNSIRASYCNHCGKRQPSTGQTKETEGRAKLYADIAHPINSACRDMIQQRVVDAYRAELDRACQPGYVPKYDEEFDDDFERPAVSPDKEKEKLHRPEQAHPLEDGPRPLRRETPRSRTSHGSDENGFGAGIF